MYACVGDIVESIQNCSQSVLLIVLDLNDPITVVLHSVIAFIHTSINIALYVRIFFYDYFEFFDQLSNINVELLV